VGSENINNCEEDCNITLECTDSDGGINYDIRGHATRPGQGAWDMCVDSERVSESYCDANDLISHTTYTCPIACEDGVCTDNPTCVDSDKGVNYYVKGYVDRLGDIKEDYCIDDNTVVDYYCYNYKNYTESIWTCDYGCVDGACKSGTLPPPPSCTESDGGNYPAIFGRLTFDNEEFEDNCIDLNTLEEYYCLANGYGSLKHECLEDCKNGYCITNSNPTPLPATCKDTDGGLNYYVKGNVSDEKGVFILDGCGDAGMIHEAYCDIQGRAWKDFQCPSNRCLDGACIPMNNNSKCIDFLPEKDINCSYGDKVLMHDLENCRLNYKCMYNLTNGNQFEMKITLNEALEALGEKFDPIKSTNLTEVKESWTGTKTGVVYNIQFNKNAKLFGIIKINAVVNSEIDAGTGEFVKMKKPWWAFLAMGV
jgi:hypothetical protein